MRAFQAALTLKCQVVLVHHPDVALPKSSPRLTLVPAGKTLFDSVAAGLNVCQTEFIIVLATDLPLVNGESLNRFFESSCLLEAEVIIALARLDACRRLGYDTCHPIPLQGEQFKFGSTFFIRRRARECVLGAIENILGLRKRPIRLVQRFLSFRFFVPLMRFMLSHIFFSLSLTYREAERLVADQIGVQARVLIADPCLAIDHD